MHIWSYHILHEKINWEENKQTKQGICCNPNTTGSIIDVNRDFFTYFLNLGNTWILGTLTTRKLPLPRGIMTCMKKRWKSLNLLYTYLADNFKRKKINNLINFMVIVLGIAMIIIGITILINISNYSKFYDVDNLKVVLSFSIMMIIMGALLIFVDIEQKRNGVAVYIFWTLLSLTFVILFSLLIIIIIQNEVSSEVKT